MKKFQALFFIRLTVTAILLCAGLGFLSCAPAEGAGNPDPRLVAAVSGGFVSGSEPLEVVFTQEQDVSKPLPGNVFRLKPAVRGSVSWADEYTLVFTPAKALAPGKRYQALVGGAGTGISPFRFAFETRSPGIEVALEPVRINSAGEVLVQGTVALSAEAALAHIEKTVKSPELGAPSWTHENGVHRFAFRPVKREGAARTAAVTWSGQPVGARDKGFATVRIPGAEGFEVLEMRQRDRQVLEIAFSSPLREDLDLRGFVSLGGETDIRYALDGNVVSIFGAGNSEGVPEGSTLIIQDLPDADGNVLAVPVQYQVQSNWELPAVNFIGTGTILPTSQGSTMAIETLNLSGVLVEAFQIYGDNMVQFLQVNGLDGTRELERVGEPVWTKAFDFPWQDSDRNRRIQRGLDLSELSRKYPDGMFHIRLSFRRRHVQYECTANHGDFSALEFPDDSFPSFQSNGQQSNWDYYDSNNVFRSDWYRYRLDPCHPAFYINYGDHNITKGQNVMVSDLGLLAKKSLDGRWFVTASDVKTARPAADVDLEILNYQGRVLAQAKTGPDGMAVIANLQGASQSPPAFVSARSPLGRSYLKINDSLALAVSHFDIAGDRPLEGIRGLIYGERGVWRPGDTIYLTFLLSDPAGTLPADHPVSFEMEDPRGQISGKQTFTSSVDGFYPIAVSTQSGAPTGDWTARVKVGGNVFNKAVKIETVMPNRLKMDLDFGSAPYLESGQMPVSLEAAWLYGAPAPGLKADVHVTFGDRETSFPGYTEYSFRDPSRVVSGERQRIYDGNLDDAGKANFTMALNAGSSVPGKLTARFLTRVFEPAGTFSSEQVSREFSPYKRYIGLKLPKGDEARNMLLTDTDHTAEILVLDGAGNPVTEDTTLDCAVYKMTWRWWWEKGEGERAEFSSALSRTPVVREQVNARQGRASWNFQVKYPDWGRYLVVVRDRTGGHSSASIVYIDWPGWAGRAQEGGQGASAMLVLTADKQRYNTAEKAVISFPSNRDAMAMITVERGGNVLKQEWIPCTGDLTRYEFITEPSMVPNVYIHVSLLQPHLQTRNDLPLRLYGILPVLVEDPHTAISPLISSASQWEAESPVSFTVSEAGGRPMTYTVAVVDEGLLGLTRYSLPNPRAAFYAREASFLKSWDLYSSIMGAYSGQLETLLAIGGGDDLFQDEVKETQRFKPVTQFFGPYEIAAGESRTQTLTLPPYIGALRIMVLGASSLKENPAPPRSGRAYGTAEKSVQVVSDVMVFGTIPRTLSPDDEFILPVSVNYYAQGPKTLKVSLDAAGARILDEPFREVVFEKSGEQTIRYRVKAPDLPGAVKFTISAEAPGLKSAVHVTDLEVRSTAIPVSKSTVRLLAPGETWPLSIDFPGKQGSNMGIAEFSRLPPLNLEARLSYLIAYPHGCVEQTTSSVFPQLYLDKTLPLDEKRLVEIRTNITAGIERLALFQIPAGGFSYWPESGEAHDWGTSYAGHFLLEARKAGYPVSQDTIDRWVRFQKNRAGAWQGRSGNQAEQAYRLYTLALAGEADLGSMNRLREQQNLSPQALWRLAAAYWYAGQRDTARNMASRLDTQVDDYRELSGTFGSALRDKAMILETLILLENTTRTKDLFEDLAQALSAESWLSTQETAYALIAMFPYMQGSAGQDLLNMDVTLAGMSRTANFTTPAEQLDMGNLSGQQGDFTVRNNSAIPVYARITVRGLPEEGAEPAMEEQLALDVEYRNMAGERVVPDDLEVGEDMEVRVRVRNLSGRAVPEIALVHLLPASWELVNDRPGEGTSSLFKYQDIRDDRVMTYFNLNRGEGKTVSIWVNRAYGGSYFRPAIHAYAMYDESIRALIPGVRASEK
ncbi:MAG: alpha-2-macroglobulin [Treponema sp.]|jgi:uncharacterized protein YfaS (alpha-2-macroglobulin family)|nr:alpha-2-macroglobulin [Treponema sp.]